MRKIITLAFVIVITSTASFAAFQEKRVKKDGDTSKVTTNLRIDRAAIKAVKFKQKGEKSFKEVLIDWLLKFE
jgi:hypothetical protein